MAPKTKDRTDKPTKKSTKETKSGKGGDGRGDGHAEEQVSEERHKLEERARKAFIGYARTDIFKRKLVFGKYNNRLLSNTHRRKLYESFKSGGLQRFSVNNSIPLIIPGGDVVEESVCALSPQDLIKRDGSHLPWLRLKADNIDVDNMKSVEKYGSEIVAAGGRHRRYALEDWFNDRKRGVATVERELRELQAQVKVDVESVSEEEMSKAAQRVVQANALVAMGGSWIVEVYNSGECDRSAITKTYLVSHGAIIDRSC